MEELQRESDETAKVDARSGPRGGEEVREPARATVLLVGDRSKIEAGVRELKLGEIVVLDAEGKPVTR